MDSPNKVPTALSLALNRGAVNMAPVEPILKLRDGEKKHESKVQKAVKELYDAKMKHEQATWNELYSMGQLVALFIQGKQLLQKKPYGAGYYVRPVAGDDTYQQKAMNLMGFYAQCCVSKMMSSNPNINIKAGDDSPESIAAAQDARPMVDYYENRFYTARFKWREALHALQNGIYIHRVAWDPFAEGGPKAQKKNVQEEELQLGGGFGECFDCDYAGEGGEFQQDEMILGGTCPKCGSGAVQVTGAEKQMMSKVSQGDEMSFGEPRITTLPFPACRWDLAKDAEDSSWFIYRQRISKGAIKLLIGDAIIPDTQSSTDIGLDLLHALAYSGQAMDGSSSQAATKRNNHDANPTMVEFWASPEDYADIQIEGGKSVSGHDLPGGRMSDIYSGPVCFVGLNDMSFITGIFAERHREQIVTGQWLMESDSGAGRGMQDTAAVQKRFNAGDGQLYQGMAASATPAVMTDMRLLKQEQAHYLFRPGQNIDINLAMLPPNFKLGDAFYQGSPGQVSGQYVGYVQTFLRDMFQLSSLVTEFSDGLIGVDNRTATGAQITSALANSLFGPMLMVNGGSRVRISEILVELHKKHCPVARYFPGQSGGGRAVSGQQLKGKLIHELTQDSQLPTTPFTRQSDIRAGIEAMGGIQGVLTLKQQDPPMFRKFAADFNWKTEPQDSDAISTLCLGRLEQMKQNLAAGVADPAILVQQLRPPVSVVEPKHKEKQEWWSDYLDLKEAQEVDPVIRAAAEAMYWTHANNATQKAMPAATNEGMIAAAGQAPMAMGAAALQQQQQKPEPQQDDQSLEIHADMAMQESEQKHDLAMKDKEIAGQESVTRLQGETAKATTKMAGDNAVRVQKARPKPKPAKAAA